MTAAPTYLRSGALVSSGFVIHSALKRPFLAGIAIHATDESDVEIARAERVAGKFQRLTEDEAAAEIIAQINARAGAEDHKAIKFRDDLAEALGSSRLLRRKDVHAATVAALARQEDAR